MFYLIYGHANTSGYKKAVNPILWCPIKMRVFLQNESCLSCLHPPPSYEGRQLSFWWKTLNLIGHYGSQRLMHLVYSRARLVIPFQIYVKQLCSNGHLKFKLTSYFILIADLISITRIMKFKGILFPSVLILRVIFCPFSALMTLSWPLAPAVFEYLRPLKF